jgi:cold shock CspA family protein
MMEVQMFSFTIVQIKAEGFKSLSEGQDVSVEIEQGPKGPSAIDVVAQ